MKTSRFLWILLAVVMLIGCGKSVQNTPAEKPQAQNVPEGFTAFTYPAGKYFQYETTWLRLPSAYKEEAEKKGTTEEVAYTTDVYGDGVTYEKHVLVYLPYGYDQNDKDTKYNVVYYEHGDGQNYKTVWTQEQFNQVDHMMANGDIPRVIIVFTTFYMLEDSQDLAGDGRSGDLPNLFYREVTESILPVIETRYNTYLTGTSKEDFIATREHRAFTGYSRGSAATWNMFHNAFEYFAYYAPMSNAPAPEQHGVQWSSDAEELAYLEAPVKAHPELPFYIYTCKGTAESIEKQTKIVELMLTSDCFKYGYDKETSNLGYTISNLNHSDRYVPYYYYSSLPMFFGN